MAFMTNLEYMQHIISDKNYLALEHFLVRVFEESGLPFPYTLCRKCKHKKICNGKFVCPYSDEQFFSAWLNSRDRSFYGGKL